LRAVNKVGASAIVLCVIDAFVRWAATCAISAAAVATSTITSAQVAGPVAATESTGDTVAAVPAPPRLSFLQYGVAFTADFATKGPFCQDSQLNCILGSGGGIVGRLGWRSPGDWYFGGAYELSKQDPTKLFRLALLQQLRFEARHYWFSGRDTQPILVLGAGIAGYGDELAIATYGVSAFIGVGVESQFQSGPVLCATLGYRPMYLMRFEDTAGTSHGPGLANMIVLEVALEERDPL
jgi:hypothetical protein